MKKLFALLLAGLAVFPASALAQAPLPDADAINRSAATRDWEALLAANRQVGDDAGSPAADGKTTPASAVRLARVRTAADEARKFYTTHPNDPLAPEARKLEIFSLIRAMADGDATQNARLASAADGVRADVRIPSGVRAQAVAAYEFSRALLPVSGMEERKDITERVARALLIEFPEEPQAYEALLAVAKASPEPKAGIIAREIATSAAPAPYKAEAQRLLDREALVGRPLAAVLGEEGRTVAAVLPSGAPVVVYSWATWGVGSLELGKMLQARRFAAIGVCLDDDIESARKTAYGAGLGGEHIYDAQGRSGALAARLAFSTAGQIYLVDAQGVIRDVRGGESLETKLRSLGFSTPPLVVAPISELLRQ